tara:strand:- start:307 stop:2985 length:2679 start_codon:yes stop_codon:yes gene_type:complete
MWLSVNLLLTAWFFVKTFRMLDGNSWEPILFRYLIHEFCVADVRERIKQTFLYAPINQNLLVNPDEQVLKVMTYKYSSDDFQHITRIVKPEKSIKDVKFRLVNIAIRLQISILKLKKIRDCKLVIQSSRSNARSNILSIAQYDGFEINPLVKLLFQAAFSFTSTVNQTDIGISAVLNGFVGPANDAIRDGDAREFSVTINNLAMWHTELAEALSFINDDEEPDNWILLPNSQTWGSYLDELLSEYYRLARDAVERIPENSRFYAEMLHLYKHIFSRRELLSNKEMRSLIQGSYYMWYSLIEWRSYSSESSDMRIVNKYEDILIEFVGDWELWLMYIAPRSKRINDLNRVYPAIITHLEFTALTAISALRFNNYEAAGWGVDMLNRWLESYSIDEHWDVEYRWRSLLINHCLLPLDSETSAWQIILKENKYDYIAASGLAFKNAHLDLRVITACYMLLKPADEQQELLIKYIKALLSGAPIHSSGAMISNNEISNGGDLLGVYIRHRDHGNYGGGTYGHWLSSILNSFDRVYEERKVSGRVYSGWGANDPKSMTKAYVEIGISLSEKKWSLRSDWIDAILSDAFKHMDRDSIIKDLSEWIKIAAETGQKYILVAPEQLNAFKTNFIESVESVIKKINKAQDEALKDAPIDQDRLDGFGSASSAIFLSENKSVFPFILFENIDRNPVLEDDYSFAINIKDYNKESVAKGIDTNRSINEDEWLANVISQNLKSNILRKLLAYPESQSYQYDDINNILSDIRNMSEARACPVLFVGNQALSSALNRSSYEGSLAETYDISRHDGFSGEYICHIGPCEVYKLHFRDVDYSILTSKELFSKLIFRRISDDRYVEAGFLLNDGSDTHGELKLKYWMKVDLNVNIECIKLELTKKEEILI